MRLEVPDRVSTSTQPFPRRARRQQGWWVPWALLGLLVAVGLAVFAGRSLSTGDRPARPELQRVLDGLVTGPDRVAPGATAYVAGPHGVWLGSAGVGDVRAGKAMPVDARMRLESVSKIYTATVVLRLAQEGRLSLGDTVERWLPGILPYGDEITVRQLLTMRSGLIDTNDLGRRPAFYLARVARHAAEGAAELACAAHLREPRARGLPRLVDPLGGMAAAPLPTRQRVALLEHRLRGARADRRPRCRHSARPALP